MRSRIPAEGFFKNFRVIEFFRDNHAKAPSKIGSFRAEAELREQEHRDPDDKKKQSRVEDKAHAGQKADSHRDEDRGDLAGRSLGGTEAHEAEGPCYRNSGADVAVNGHDDDTDDSRKDRESPDK